MLIKAALRAAPLRVSLLRCLPRRDSRHRYLTRRGWFAAKRRFLVQD
jgi:hypothetical protein